MGSARAVADFSEAEPPAVMTPGGMRANPDRLASPLVSWPRQVPFPGHAGIPAPSKPHLWSNTCRRMAQIRRLTAAGPMIAAHTRGVLQALDAVRVGNERAAELACRAGEPHRGGRHVLLGTRFIPSRSGVTRATWLITYMATRD